jgi:hypothetical protein
MSKEEYAFHAADISALARSLRTQLAGHAGQPGHVEMLHMLARAAGYRNFQHFRAQQAARRHLEREPAAPPPTVDFVKLGKLARYFAPGGPLLRWPSKFSHQEPCLWVLWSRLPARRNLAEPEVNALLIEQHSFGDHVLLRREMVNYGMVGRTTDCRTYWRVERELPPEAVALMRLVAGKPA